MSDRAPRRGWVGSVGSVGSRARVVAAVVGVAALVLGACSAGGSTGTPAGSASGTSASSVGATPATERAAPVSTGSAGCSPDQLAAAGAPVPSPPATGEPLPVASAPGGTDETGDGSGTASTGGPPAQETFERVAVPGGSRTYRQHTPTTGQDRPRPLIIDLHGYLSGADGQYAISAWPHVADREGIVVVEPQGNGDLPYWNAGPVDGLPDDVAFVDAVIDDVARTTCIDPRRVYVAGMSNGAFLASLLACRSSDRIAAVATVAGLQFPADCAPGRAVPVLAIHGTDDQFVPFDGGRGPALDTLRWNDETRTAFAAVGFDPVRRSLARWAAANGCAAEPTSEPVVESVTRWSHPSCRDGAAVELLEVAGGGHTWPGSAFSAASAAVLGPTTMNLDADEAIWSFFRDHPLPAG